MLLSLASVALLVAPSAPERTLAVGDDDACVIGKDGRHVTCVGKTEVRSHELPEEASGKIVHIDASDSRLCARTEPADMLHCWTRRRGYPRDTFEHAQIEDVADVGVGDVHTCVVRGDGGVACWGLNDHGQLGDGSRVYRHTPTAIEIDPAVAVEVDGPRSCALLRDATVACWGDNPIWFDTRRLRPTRVPELRDVTRLLEGYRATRGGSLVAWDTYNDRPRLYKAPSSAAPAIVDVAGRCRLRADGEVECAGAYREPHRPMGLRGIVELSGGDDVVCARDAELQTWCWRRPSGFRGATPLPTPPSLPPAPVEGTEGLVDVVVGEELACGRTSDGDVSCWTERVRRVALPSPARELAIKGAFVCARTDDGVWCWHAEEHPTKVLGAARGRRLMVGSRVIHVVRGRRVRPIFSSSVRSKEPIAGEAVTAPGPVVAFLRGEHCYPRAGAMECASSGRRGSAEGPVRIALDVGKLRHVTSAYDSVCGIRRDGTVACHDALRTVCTESKVGARHCEERDVSTELRDVADIDIDDDFGCVVLRDGRTQCWRTADRPTGAPMIADIGRRGLSSIAVGEETACAVDPDGRVWCWGSAGGPLGARHQPTALSHKPVRMPWLDGRRVELTLP